MDRATLLAEEIANHPPTRTPLYSSAGLLLATGYVQIITLEPAVAQKHGGPYIEITPEQICKENLHLITNVRHTFFYEYRSNDPANVMVYLQRRPISYKGVLHYRRGFYYIPLSDVRWKKEAAA